MTKPLDIISRAEQSVQYKDARNNLASLWGGAIFLSSFWAVYYGEQSQDRAASLEIFDTELSVATNLSAILAEGKLAVRVPVNKSVKFVAPALANLACNNFTAVTYTDVEGTGDWPIVASAEGDSLDILDFCKLLSTALYPNVPELIELR